MFAFCYANAIALCGKTADQMQGIHGGDAERDACSKLPCGHAGALVVYDGEEEVCAECWGEECTTDMADKELKDCWEKIMEERAKEARAVETTPEVPDLAHLAPPLELVKKMFEAFVVYDGEVYDLALLRGQECDECTDNSGSPTISSQSSSEEMAESVKSPALKKQPDLEDVKTWLFGTSPSRKSPLRKSPSRKSASIKSALNA
ncbi:hypothetical protein T484DRAFT_1833475 [Baffinella frigidus]|nr:hypothetical protein T484DRAFT_1833475 [Cryptophyta sp. CCMP2293]